MEDLIGGGLGRIVDEHPGEQKSDVVRSRRLVPVEFMEIEVVLPHYFREVDGRKVPPTIRKYVPTKFIEIPTYTFIPSPIEHREPVTRL